MTSMKIIINFHNHKITNPKTITKERTCNCIYKAKCRLRQNCLINNIIREAWFMSTNPNFEEKNYFGTVEATLNFQTTKQTVSYPTKHDKWKSYDKHLLYVPVALLKSKEHLKFFVNYINSKHKNINFTLEAEDLNSFSFLDVKSFRINKRFVTFS